MPVLAISSSVLTHTTERQRRQAHAFHVIDEEDVGTIFFLFFPSLSLSGALPLQRPSSFLHTLFVYRTLPLVYGVPCRPSLSRDLGRRLQFRTVHLVWETLLGRQQSMTFYGARVTLDERGGNMGM